MYIASQVGPYFRLFVPHFGLIICGLSAGIVNYGMPLDV